MANQNNQKGAPVEETLSKNEAFFLKYQKQIIGAVYFGDIISEKVICTSAFVSRHVESDIIRF